MYRQSYCLGNINGFSKISENSFMNEEKHFTNFDVFCDYR